MTQYFFTTLFMLILFSGSIYGQSRIQNIYTLLHSPLIKIEMDDMTFSGLSYYYHTIYLNKRQNQKTFRLATKASKQRLDSILIRDYNETDAVWINNAKQIFNYDSSGNCLKYIQYFWDEYEDKWNAFSKRKYSYDNNNMIQVIIFSWDKMNKKWRNFIKNEIDYGDTDNSIEDIRYEWDDYSKKWEKFSKHNFTYRNDTLTGFIFHSWSESSEKWMPQYKYEYIYNDIGLVNQINRKLWNASTVKWENGSKSDITYDNDGSLSLTIGYIWDNSIKEYTPSDKTEYTMDNNNYPIKIIDFEWNVSQDKWVAINQDEYERDNVGNALTYIYSNWEADQQQFIPSTKFTNKYEKSYEESDLILPPSDISVPGIKSEIVNMPTTYSRYNKNNLMQWEEESNGTFYYSEQSITITALIDDPQVIKIYPNPVQDHVNIELSSNNHPVIFKVYDVQGNNIITRALASSNTKISLRNLYPGMYFYSIYSQGFNRTGKIKVE